MCRFGLTGGSNQVFNKEPVVKYMVAIPKKEESDSDYSDSEEEPPAK